MLDDYKSAGRRNGRNITTGSPWICKLATPVAGALDGVLEQAGDRHRADAARNGRHQRRDVERAEAIDALWHAIDGLPVDLKMALLLRDVVGLSYNEIADSLEVTLATVKWRIFKAREDVQLALAREGITFGAGVDAQAL